MDCMKAGARLSSTIAITLTLFFSAATAAQSEEEGGDAEYSVKDKAEAAEAYDQGTSAYLSERYELAAHWFERAYRVVPTPAALSGAIRAHDRADNPIRAANLALLFQDKYPSEQKALLFAEPILQTVKLKSVLVQTECERECAIEVDGAVSEHHSFFVSPGEEHELTAAYDTGETDATVIGQAGEKKHVLFKAPIPPPPPPVPRWAFISSLAATVAMGGVTLWSGLDANNGVSDFESAATTANSPGINNGPSPTPADDAQSLLDDGQRKERRTNALIGVTAGLAAGTIVLGIFTNWKNESREPRAKRVEPSIGAGRDGGSIAIKGRF